MTSTTNAELGQADRAQKLSSDTRTWTIAELAREFDVTPRTIRFYEDEGLIKPRRQGLNRIFSAGDRVRLGWILRGKRVGLSLAEIRALLDLYYVDRTGVQQMRAILTRTRDHIVELEQKLGDLQAQLAELREIEASAEALLASKEQKIDKRAPQDSQGAKPVR